MKRIRALALSCAAALAGCADTVEIEGRYIRFVADADLKVCGGTVAYLDDFYARLANTFGAPLPEGPEIEYRYMSYEMLQTSGICGGEAAGCAVWRRRQIYMSSPVSGHELVHVAAGLAYGLPDVFYAEGLAVAFAGDEYPVEDIALPDQSAVLEVLRTSGRRLPGTHYQLAGAFVGYLVDRFGLARMLELYRASRYLERAERAKEAFHEVFGVSMDEVVADFDRERRECPLAGYRIKQQECSAPALDWDGERLAARFTIDCEASDVVGPIGFAQARLWRTLRVEESGLYRLELRGDADASVRLMRCGGCDDHLSTTLARRSPRATLELPAGRYVLQISGSYQRPTEVGLTLTRLADATREPDVPDDEAPP